MTSCTKCDAPIAAGERHLRETVDTPLGNLPIFLCASCVTHFTALEIPGQRDEIHQFASAVRLRAMLEHADPGAMGSA
jgi:hypothetical protein